MWSNERVKAPLRAVSAVLCIVAVLFSQLAMSAYACPGADGMATAASAAQEVPPCHEQEPRDEPSALCAAHCQQGDQSLDRSVVPAVALVALPGSVFLAALPVQQPAPRAGSQSSLLERPTGPPLAVRHCRFRI